jgi:hypothetical protein
MTTHVTTHNPVRSDVAPPQELAAVPTSRPSRGWARTGVLAAVTSFGALVASYGIDSIYDPELAGDAPAIANDLEDKAGFIIAFHVLETLAAVLLAVFALGLFRRLRAAMPGGSLVPGVAAFGLLGTSVVMVLAAGLDTEFAFAQNHVTDDAYVQYNHWTGTIPGVWVLAGMTGLALFSASRARAVPRWIGLVGLVLGGLALVSGISPLQYIAVAPAGLMLLLVSLGFAFGDRSYRA